MRPPWGTPTLALSSVRQCANITLRNCFATGHKIYSTIGAAGKPVNMGSYDYNANNVVNFRMINCTMNHITDRTRWGVIAIELLQEHPARGLHPLQDGHAHGRLRHLYDPPLHAGPDGAERHRSRHADGRRFHAVRQRTGQFPPRLWQHLGGRSRHPQLPLDSGLRRHVPGRT